MKKPNLSKEEWQQRMKEAVNRIPCIYSVNNQGEMKIQEVKDKATREVLSKIIIVDDNGQERIATVVAVNKNEIIIK